MTTRDIVLGYADGWLAVIPLGTYAYMHNTSDHALKYRFGIDSTSSGVILGKGCYIKVNEVVYIKDGTHFKAKLIVIGD